VVTSTIVFEGNGQWREYEGGVQDWLIQSRRAQALALAAAPATDAKTTGQGASSAKPGQSSSIATPRKKLSYREQRELDALPGMIEALEEEQNAIQGELSDGSLYVREPDRAQRLSERSARIDDDLMAALERWESLSSGL
jgi:ATP-binding cassette subfamily F protein uup